MRMLKGKVALLGVLVVSPFLGGYRALPVVAAEEEASLPKEARDLLVKALALKSYRTQFVLEAKEENGEIVRLVGTLLFRRPNQRRLELRLDGSDKPSQLLISDGTVEWQYDLVDKKVYKIPNPPEIPGPHQPFAEGQAATFRFVEQMGTGAEALSRFEATPLPAVVKDSPIPIQTLRVDVGASDGLVRKLSLLDAQGQEVLSQRYQNVEVNVSFPEGTFTFVKPDDVAVEDLGRQ